MTPPLFAGCVRPGFETAQFSPMFGASAPLDDVLVAARGAGFTEVGVDLASVEAHVAAGGTVEPPGWASWAWRAAMSSSSH